MGENSEKWAGGDLTLLPGRRKELVVTNNVNVKQEFRDLAVLKIACSKKVDVCTNRYL